jgi:hypothetical protein
MVSVENKSSLRCLGCGTPVIQSPRKQGGGTTKRWCSRACYAAQWAQDHTMSRQQSRQKYDTKPENKLKKRIRQRDRHPWLRTTPEYRLFQHAQWRARIKKLLFTIRVQDIHIPETCPLLGIPLIAGTRTVNANSPSIDRIDSTQGYIPTNVWVVSHKANTAKSNLTIQELKRLVENLEVAFVNKGIHETGR